MRSNYINRPALAEFNFIRFVTVFWNRNYNTTITYCIFSKNMRIFIYLYI